jgi:hypothetical protein
MSFTSQAQLLGPLGPGAGTYNYPSSVTLDAQGRVTAVGANFTAAGFTMTGVIQLPNAAVGAPGLTFSGDTTIGLWRDAGAGFMYLTTGGTVNKGLWIGLAAADQERLAHSASDFINVFTNNIGLNAPTTTFSGTLSGNAYTQTANATRAATQPVGVTLTGFTWTHTGGQGSAVSGANPAGPGGAIAITAGGGGDGTAGQAAGAGAKAGYYGGSAGVNNGGGGANGGDVEVDAGAATGAGTAGLVQLGRPAGNNALSVRFNTGRRTVFRGSAVDTNIVSTDETLQLTAAAAANRTFTLPAAHVAGQRFTIINASTARTLNVALNGNKLDGSATSPLAMGLLTAGTPNCRTIVSDGTDWWTMEKN